MAWPQMDDDALPSSFITKVLQCMGKWTVKLQTMFDVLDTVEEPRPETIIACPDDDANYFSINVTFLK